MAADAAGKSGSSLASCGLSEGIKAYPDVPARAGLSAGYATENRGFCQHNWPLDSDPISLETRADNWAGRCGGLAGLDQEKAAPLGRIPKESGGQAGTEGCWPTGTPPRPTRRSRRR